MSEDAAAAVVDAPEEVPAAAAVEAPVEAEEEPAAVEEPAPAEEAPAEAEAAVEEPAPAEEPAQAEAEAAVEEPAPAEEPAQAEEEPAQAEAEAAAEPAAAADEAPAEEQPAEQAEAPAQEEEEAAAPAEDQQAEQAEPAAPVEGADAPEQVKVEVPAVASEEEPVEPAEGFSAEEAGQHMVEAESPVTAALQALGAEVVERFRQQHRHVSTVLATFVVSTLRVSDPAAQVDEPPSAAEGARLVDQALERLGEASSPEMETIRMQVAFETVYAVAVQRLQDTYDERREKNQGLLARVLEIAGNLSSNDAVAGLYRAFFRLLLENGSVKAVDRQVEREVAAALESVFPQSGLNAFSISTPAQRRGHITDLVSVVLGIRLFNRHIGKGGAGLDDVPGLALRQAAQLEEDLRAETASATQLCGQYTQVLLHEYRRPGSIGGAVPVLREELTNRRQLLLFLQQLQHEADDSLRAVHAGRERFEETLARVQELVSDRASVPKEEVYPLFHDLAVLWTQLEAEVDKNKSRRSLLAELLRCAGSFETSLSPRDLAASEMRRAQDEAEAEAEEAAPFDFVRTLARGNANGEGLDEGAPVRLVQESTPDFFAIALEYQGFCPWSIVRREGFLVPGNPVLGVVRWGGRHYSLSSKPAMREFCADPERYVAGAEQAVRRAPHLINVLGLQDDVAGGSIHDLLPEPSAAGISEMTAGGRAVSVDADCQTDVHMIEPGIDHKYEWNEWELRRRALQLANLTSKRTHSTQTDKSHFRRDAEAQTYLKRPNKDGTMPGQGTQTGIAKGTNVPRTRRYVAGLRGAPGTKASLVTLTLDSVVTNGTNRPFV